MTLRMITPLLPASSVHLRLRRQQREAEPRLPQLRGAQQRRAAGAVGQAEEGRMQQHGLKIGENVVKM